MGASRGQGGRPRADGSSSDAPRDEIIAVATRVFAEEGYAGTTMTRIAKLCGMRQASLYYWFANKEDLLRATAAVNRHAVEVVRALSDVEASPGVKLHRLLYEDTRAMCNGPCDYNEIERLAYQRPDEFAVFWQDYRLLFDAISGFVQDGVDDGQFCPQDDVPWAAASALLLNEGAQKLYRLQRGKSASRYLPLGVDLPADPSGPDTPHRVAERSATTSLTALLADRSTVGDVVAGSLALELAVSA
jgi:TetR/AcrR family transcriptional regulator